MTQIKFRVVDITNPDNEVIIGHERVNDNGEWEHQRVKRQNWLLGCITMGQESRKFERRQYTGINDKNDDEIFSGNKLQYMDIIGKPILYGTVIFDEGCFSLHIDYLYRVCGYDMGSKPPLFDFLSKKLVIL